MVPGLDGFLKALYEFWEAEHLQIIYLEHF